MSKSIFEFKKGDKIVRVEPAKSYGTSLFGEPLKGDRSYIGEELEFMGVLNGCVYVKPIRITWINKKDDLRNLPLDVFSEGWDYWVDPKSLLDDSLEDAISATESELKKRIELAIADENYELADKLSKLIKRK